jgi:hypothetical protein
MSSDCSKAVTMQTVLPFMLLEIAVVILIGVPIGAVFLRVAISFCNRIIGPKRPSMSPALVDIPNTAGLPSDDSNPYAPPKTVAVAIENSMVDTIPLPRLASACGIVLAAITLGTALNFVAMYVGPGAQGSPLLLQILSLAVSFLAPVFVYTAMLPTSIRRAALVYLIQGVMALIFFGVIFAAAWNT